MVEKGARAAEVSREACNNAELKRQEKKRHNSYKARLKDRRIPHLDAAREQMQST
jgi:hypothetical protein